MRPNLMDASTLQDDLDTSIQLAKEYMSLQKSLVTGNADEFRWDGDKSEEPLFHAIMNEVAMNSLGSGSVSETIALPDGTQAGLYIFGRDCTVGTDTPLNRGVVVSNGNVTIGNSFDGLIIANGTINMMIGGLQLNADSMIVNEVMDWAARNGFAHYFNGVEEMDVLENNVVSGAIVESMTFKNWMKNEFGED
jgi:hypothetical protein